MRREPPTEGGRRGFVVALALLVLVAVALLASLLFEAGIEELRAGHADLARVRAASLVEEGLADIVAPPADSTLAGMPRGGWRRRTSATGNDSTLLSLQALGGSVFRITVESRVIAAGARARQWTVAFVRLTVDSAGGRRTFRMRPIDDWWRSQRP